MNKLFKATLIILALSIVTPMTFAEAENKQAAKINTEVSALNTGLVFKNNYIKAKYASAENRFLQGNVKAAHDDYESIITKISHDDYFFLVYAVKMAEYGFFDLTEELFKKLDNNLYTENYVNDIKKYFYPSAIVNISESLKLADAYANIVYNNLAIETTSDLLSNNDLSESDYKNYLIALGYYKSNNLPQALKFINNAILVNNENVNYKVLKAKILADSKKGNQAIKILKEIKEKDFLTVDFQEKIEALEQYVQYKIAKDEPLKDYHLAYYYHLQGKSILATKVLQSTILQAKNYAPRIFGLLAHIYYENDEPLKAQEFAIRGYKEDNKNYLSILTLANLSFDERKFEEALNYYQIAKKINKKDVSSVIGIAKSYIALENKKKSQKLYEKLLKKNELNEELLINSLKAFPHRADDYLPMIASVDIFNNDVWLAMAQKAIRDRNYTMAEVFLNNSYYIDENNFKYYYYLSLLLKAKGDFEKSKQALIKCDKLNSDYAKKIEE